MQKNNNGEKTHKSIRSYYFWEVEKLFLLFLSEFAKLAIIGTYFYNVIVYQWK